MDYHPGKLINKFVNRFKYRAALSQRHTKRLLIPYEGNSHRPYLLRQKSLTIIASVVIGVKIGVMLLVGLTPGLAFPVDITNQNIVNLTNQERTSAGLPELKLNRKLAEAAAAKAADMLSNQYFAHYSPSNVSPWFWFKTAGYNYAYAGENLAMDFTTAESTMEAWMASDSHKKNILNTKYSEIGVGVAEGDFKGAKTILVVQEFGAPAPVTTLAENTTVQKASQPVATQPKPATQTVTPKVATQNNLPTVETPKTVVLPSPVKENTYDVTVKVNPPAAPAPTPATPEPTPSVVTQVAVTSGSNTADLNKNGDTYTGSVQESNNGQNNDLKVLVQGTGSNNQESNVVTIPVVSTDFFKTYVLQPTKFFTSDRLVQLIFYSRNFFLALLIFLSLALILDVLIKVRVQHRPTILYTLLVIYMISVIVII